MARAVKTLVALLMLLTAAAAEADTVIVTVDRALIWNRPNGPSFVLTQVPRATKLDVIVRVGEWYQVVLPPGTGLERVGYIRSNQVAIDSTGPLTPAARVAATAAAGNKPVRTQVAFLNLDYSFRLGAVDFIRSAPAFEKELAEAGAIDANYGNGRGPQYDLLSSQAIWGQIGVGFGVSYYQRTGSTHITARVPHPFLFNQFRNVTGDIATPTGSELAIHLPIVWIPKSGRKTKILIYGGPTVFRLTQNVVTGLKLDDPYPHDTATLTGVLTDKLTGVRPGFHAGADVAYFFGGRVGLGVGARYSLATIKLTNDATGAVTTGKVGGPQVSGGLRVRF